eukprot:XP_025013641.1 LOW QUALITY PROTEIN: disease resistance-like protein DSC1 [Ricinus communis]
MPIMLSSSIRKMLSRRKVLIVLDDVSDLKQIELLIGKHTSYGPRSRIIMTSRDKQLLQNAGAEIYEVEELNGSEALLLFCLHAFKQDSPKKGYMALSERAIKYAQGVPLALKVLGSNLYSRDVEEWEDELEKLKGASDEEIRKVLRISYDELCENEKEIFLDIACFLKGVDKDRAESILDVHGSRIGIRRLLDKSLISISNNELDMHDLLEQMAKDIICQEKQLGKRSRLWQATDIHNVFTKDKGTEAIKGISLDMSSDLELSPTAFQRMDNLRFLKFYNDSGKTKVHLPKGLEFLPDELRFLYWYHYPSKSLPVKFSAENLVELHLCNSQLKELWNGVQYLVNLRFIDLSYSEYLFKFPDMSRAQSLEVLYLSFCASLVEIPLSLTYLSKLTELNLPCCTSLSSLPSFYHLKSLKFLSFELCQKIRAFPEIPCNLIDLSLGGTAVKQVSSSIGCLSQLCKLKLDWCERFVSLPDSICNLKCLRYFDIMDCVNLLGLPEKLGNLESLEVLIASGTGIKELPDTICNLKYLKYLDISKCVNLHGLPNDLGNLASLEELIASKSGLRQVPPSINQLKKLIKLYFDECEGLKLPPLTGLPYILEVHLEYCGISEIPNSLCSLGSLENLFVGGNNFDSIPESIEQLSNLVVLDLSDCKRLKYLPVLPSLNYLHARNCTSMESAFSSIQLLEEQQKLVVLEFGNCISLDRAECDKVLDLALARYSLDSASLCLPGSEVPRKMKHQNKNGYSLSLSFRVPEQLNFSFLLFSAVFDPKVYGPSEGVLCIGCTVNFLEKYGHCHNQVDSCWNHGSCSSHCMAFQSEHVFVWAKSVDFIWREDDLCNIVVEFFAGAYKTEHSCDAIIKCGFHLLLNDDE